MHDLRILSRSPGEMSTPGGRARVRIRMAVWATLTSVAYRGLAMLLLVLGVRLTTAYLGTTRFGVWATFASMTAMLSLLDLGVGNALVNRIAHAVAKDDDEALRRISTGGAGVLAVIGLFAAAGLSLVALVVPWGSVLQLDAATAGEARTTALTFATLFGVNLAGSSALRVLAGQQRMYEANLLSGLATGLACIALWFAASQEASVPWLLLATFGTQTLAGLGAAALLVRRRLITLRGSMAAMASERPQLLRVGSLFVLLQLGTMLGWGSDSLILAMLKGASEVAVYAVALRLFQLASQPFAMLNAPLWAAYADANARRDTEFVRRALSRSLLISGIGTALLASALVLAGPSLISVWTHNTITIPIQLLALFAVWTVLDACGNAFGVYLNGIGIVREQVWVVAAFCTLALPLKLAAGSEFGAVGLVAATIVSYGIAVIGPYTTVLRKRVLRPTIARTA